MKLETRILLAAAGAVALSTVCGIGIVHHISSKTRVTELRTKMSSIISQSEFVAKSMDDMHEHHVFDMAGLVKSAKAQANGRPLKEMYSETDLYKTVPIVAAWTSVAGAAEKNGFIFKVTARPGMQPRNPQHTNSPDFLPAFAAFEKGETEYFMQDSSRDLLILARPVRLQASCLNCHGDPATSPNKDGRDILGFPMENMKQGDLQGAFVLTANIGHDPVVAATMKTMAAGGTVVLVLVLVGFYFFNQRSVLRPLSAAINRLDHVSSQVAEAAAEISHSSQAIADGASNQAASLEETSASLEELSSMTSQTASNAGQLNAMATQTRAAATDGTKDMEAMSKASAAIKDSNSEIAKIIRTIDEIAFQTNILALNAAVEAARAGEAGMGFAVVADEVRTLAQRSAQAAKETGARIKGAIDSTKIGVELSGKLAGVLQTILSEASKVDELAQQLAQSSKEQSTGITQLNSAVTQMDQVTQSNAAASEQSAAAAISLEEQASAMRATMAELRQLVGSAPQSTASPAAENGDLAASSRSITKPALPAQKAFQSRKTGRPAISATPGKRERAERQLVSDQSESTINN